jgi:Ca-activated chloride channel family protein
LARAQSSTQPAATQRPATAQTEGRSAHGTYTLRQDVNEVVLNCTVLDDKGHLVNGLDKSNFKVTEGKVAQTLIALKHQDVPVSMGVLIDSSGSMRDKRQAVNEAALDLVKASNPEDEAFIVNFSDQAHVAQDFTTDILKLSDGLKRSSGSSGGTALYDTVASSADRMARTATRPKQVLILVTDGEDNASSLTLEQAVQHIQNLNGPIVYSIGLLYDTKGGEARNAKHALEELSDETGGVAYFPHSIVDVDAIAAERIPRGARRSPRAWRRQTDGSHEARLSHWSTPSNAVRSTEQAITGEPSIHFRLLNPLRTPSKGNAQGGSGVKLAPPPRHSNASDVVSRSVGDAERELQHARGSSADESRGVDRGGDRPEARGHNQCALSSGVAHAQGCRGLSVLCPVEDIEGLGTEDDAVALADVEGLLHSGVILP